MEITNDSARRAGTTALLDHRRLGDVDVDPNVLARISLFAELNTDDLSGLAAHLRQRRYSRGQVVFFKGDPGNTLYVIQSGQVKIVLTSPEGKELVLAMLGPGDFFGELALLDGDPRSADAVAHEECQLLYSDNKKCRRMASPEMSRGTD